MSRMGNYIYGLILVGVAAAVAELITVGRDVTRTKGYLRLVSGLCVLVACLSPLQEGITYLKALADGEISAVLPPAHEVEDYPNMFDGYLADTGGAEVTAWVEDTLTDVFGISREYSDVEVRMVMREGVPYPEEIYISQPKRCLKQPLCIHWLHFHYSLRTQA